MTFKFAPAFCLMLFAGCSSLSVPAKNESHPRAVQIEGAHGEISRRESKALLARAKNGSEPTGIFERHLAQIQRIAGSPLTTGNKVTLLMDGPSTYKSMYAAIMDARDHINMETYSIEADEVGRRFVDALIAKQKHGVQVNLIYDSVGSGNTPAEFFQPLIDSGAKVLEFNPLNPLVLRKKWEAGRDHRKLLIVDGEVAFNGGVGIADAWEGNGMQPDRWRDMQFRVEGPAAAQMQAIFGDNWLATTGEALLGPDYYPETPARGDLAVQAFASSPDGGSENMQLMYLMAINGARRRIDLEAAYFVPDELTLTALRDAMKRGVRVRLVVPGPHVDSKVVRNASQAQWGAMLQAGARMYRYQPALFHNKLMIVDGYLTIGGSANFDNRSFQLNDESNINIYDRAFAAHMTEVIDQDIARSHELTLSQWRERPWRQRVFDWLSSQAAEQL